MLSINDFNGYEVHNRLACDSDLDTAVEEYNKFYKQTAT